MAIESPHQVKGQARGVTPFAGGCLGEPVAVLAVGVHERNATLNYRRVLARELTVEDAELYRRPGHRRRARRVKPDGEAAENV